MIELIEPRGTFSNELGLPFVALVPDGTPIEDLSNDPPPATGPYEIVASNQAEAGNTRATRSGRKPTAS